MEDRTGVDTGRRSKVKEEPGKKPVMRRSENGVINVR